MRRLRGQARAGADGSPIVLCRDLHLKRPPLPELFVNPQSAGEATHCLSPAWSSSSCSSFEATDGEDIAEGIKVDEIGKDSDFDRHFDTKIDDFLKEYGTTADGRRDTLSLEQLQGLPDEVGRQSPNRENDIRKEDRAASVNLKGEPARVGRFDDDPFGLHEPSASTYMQDEEERRPEAKDVTACSSDDSDNKSNNDEEDDGHSAHSDKRSVDGADAVDDLDAELDIDDDGVDTELAQITSIAFDPTEVVTLSWYPQILSAISNIATARDADKTREGASPGESDQADALTRPFDVSLVASTPSPQLAPANPASANGGRCTDEAEEEQESLPAVGHLRDGDSSGWKHPRLGFLRSQLSPVLSRDVTPAQHDLQLASSLACFEGISILQDIDAPIVHPDIMDPAIGYIGVGAGESATEQGAVTPIPVPASTMLVGPLTSSGTGGSPDRWNSPVVTPLPKKALADENLGGPPLFPPPSVHVASCLYNISLSSFTLQARVTVQDLPPLEDQHYSIRIYVNSPYVALPSLDIKWAPARLTLTLVRGEGLVSFSSPGPSATADMTGIDYQGLPVDIVLRAQPLSLGSAGKASAAPPPPSAVDLTVVARIESPIPPHDMVLTDAFTLAIPATQNAVVVHTPGLPTCCEANQDGNVNAHVKIAGLESTLPSLVIEGIDPMLVPTPNTAASVDCAVMLEKHDWLIYSVASREVLYSRSLTIARNIAINYWSSSLMNDNFAETPLCLSYFTRYAYHIDYGAFEGCKSRAGADGGIATLELDVCTLRPHFMRIGSLVERSRLKGAPFSHDTDDKPCDDMLIDESTVPVVVIDVPVASHEDLRLIRLNGQEVVPVFRRQNDNKSITLLLTINRNVSQLSEVAADTIRISFSVGPPPKPDDEDSSVGVPRVHGSYAHLFVSLGEGDMWCGLDPVNIIPTALESASLRVSLPTGPSIEGRGHEAAWALHEVKPVIDYLSLSTFPVPEVDNDKSAYPTATFNSASKVCRRQLLHGSSIQEFSLLKQSSFDDTINTVDAFPPYDYMMSIKPRSGEPLSKSQSPPLLMQANDVPEKARGMKAGLAEPDAAPSGTDGDAQDTLGEEQHPHSMPESLKMLFEKDEEEDGDSNGDEEVAGRNGCDKPVEEKHENGDTSGPNQAGDGESVDTTDATPPLALETRQKCRGGLTLGQSFCWFLVAIVGAVIMAAAAFLAQRSNVTAILNIHSPGSAGHKALGTGLPTTAARAEADQEPYMAATATVLAVTTTADATMVGNIHNDGIEDQGHTRSNPGLRQSPPYIVKYRPKRPALSTTMEQGVTVAWGEVIKFFDNLKRAVGEYIQQRLAQLENKPDGNNDSVPPT
ncbi:hypothetical protein EV182_000869 [Spiromyces aspiralis]|uniref:Uncharacterized protein n=1 Tax=Spiromyces aspiralis TaxID=68401 RepID=A0ACC1HGG2_9FUNG|nr:hypothetical protein EV182_000869 [Spiromyces aspiralis]